MKARKMIFRGLVVWALVFLTSSFGWASTITIIKLNLGGVGPNVGMNGQGNLSTVNDGLAPTTGDQNTGVEFTGFLGFLPNTTTNTASFSLNNLNVNAPAQVLVSTLMLQTFTGGTLNLYDSANALLLSGSLATSALSGNLVGSTGAGTGLFTTSFMNLTGGTLAPFVAPGSVTLSMNLSNVNGGSGFTVTGGGPLLNPFAAVAAANITGDPAVPEPAVLALVILGSAACLAFGRRQRRLA